MIAVDAVGLGAKGEPILAANDVDTSPCLNVTGIRNGRSVPRNSYNRWLGSAGWATRLFAPFVGAGEPVELVGKAWGYGSSLSTDRCDGAAAVRIFVIRAESPRSGQCQAKRAPIEPSFRSPRAFHCGHWPAALA
jgi:hypothetical protein